MQRPRAGQPRAINNPCGGLGGRARSRAISVLDGVQNSSGNNGHGPAREEDARTLTEHMPPAPSPGLDRGAASHRPGRVQGGCRDVPALPREAATSVALAQGTFNPRSAHRSSLWKTQQLILPFPAAAPRVAPPDLGLLHPQHSPVRVPIPGVPWGPGTCLLLGETLI